MCMYRDISPTSQIRAEARMTSGYFIWAKYLEASEAIDLHGLFNDYWSSNDHEFTVLGQSLLPIGPHRSDGEEQRPLPLEITVDL